MSSLLAWSRAFAIPLLLLFSLNLTLLVHAREESLFTSSVTYCNPPESLLIQRFEVAYFPSNASVSFNVSASSVQPGINVTANLFLNVYGMNPVNVTLNLCNLLNGALCPLPMYNFTGSDSISLPKSFSVMKKLPAIAFKIPDLEGFAQLSLTDMNTGAMRACVQTTISNGWSIHQPAVEWTTGGVTLVGLIAAAWHSAVSPELMVPFRLLELVYLYQTIASSAFLNLNYPSVYRAFTVNFAWAVGLISSPESALEKAINRMRHITGGRLADSSGGSAVGLVNRKLSPYNVNGELPPPPLNVRDISVHLTSNFSRLFRRSGQHFSRETIKGQVQTVTAASSNVLQAGVPIYVNTVHISTANAFMTVFIIGLCMFVVAAGALALGYVILRCIQMMKGKEAVPSGFDYLAFAKSWFIRLALVAFLPLFIFIFYQWTLKDSWLSIFLSVITLIGLGALIIHPSFQTLRLARQETSLALYDYQSPQLFSHGPLYAQYRPQRYYFFLSLLTASFLRALFIAFAKSSSEAQIALMLVVEFGLVASHFILKPAKTKGGDVFSTYLAITRFAATGLMVAFLERLQVKAIPRVVIGIVIVVAFSVAIIVTVVNLAWHFVADTIWIWRKWWHGKNGNRNIASFESPHSSEGSTMEKRIRGSNSGTSEEGTAEKGSFRRGNGGSGETLGVYDTVGEVGRPINPTPDQNIPMDPSILTSFPISPTVTTVSSVEPPSLYSKDSGTMTVGSLLPRRWSFSFSQPASPVGSSLGHQHGQSQSYSYQRSSLTPSPMHSTPSTPPEDTGLSRNPSLRAYQQRHEDIQEELETSFSSSSTVKAYK